MCQIASANDSDEQPLHPHATKQIKGGMIQAQTMAVTTLKILGECKGVFGFYFLKLFLNHF